LAGGVIGSLGGVRVKRAEQLFQRLRDLGGKSGLPIGSRGELEQLSNALLESLFPVARGIRLLGISLSSFAVDESERQREISLSL
jgi:hypothetical protein